MGRIHGLQDTSTLLALIKRCVVLKTNTNLDLSRYRSDSFTGQVHPQDSLGVDQTLLKRTVLLRRPCQESNGAVKKASSAWDPLL